LESVAAQFAKRIIIAANFTLSREQRDAYTMQALIALKSHNWPARGDILLKTSLPMHVPTFQRVGGANTHILTLDHVVANIVVLCSEFSGLCSVIDKVVGFEGSEFYTVDVPTFLVGKTFREASFHYPQAVVVGCGTNDKGDPELCSDPKQELTMGEQLLIVAECPEDLDAQEQPCINLQDANHSLGRQCGTPRPASTDHPGGLAHLFDGGDAFSGKKMTILFLGWSKMLGLMIIKLEHRVPKGTRVVSFDSTTVDDRKQRIRDAQVRYNTNLEHIKVEYVQGDLCSKKGFDEMLDQYGSTFWNEVGRVFIVSEHTPAEAWQDDASTMATATFLRSSLTQYIPDRSEHPPVVVELHSAQSRSMAINQGFENYVMTSNIPSQVMATVARQPLLKEVLPSLFSNRRHPIKVRGLTSYIQVPDKHMSLTFYNLQSIISNSHDILIGWSVPQDNVGCSPRGYTDEDEVVNDNWEFNPADKQGVRSWDVAKDKMIVISGNSADQDRHHHENH